MKKVRMAISLCSILLCNLLTLPLSAQTNPDTISATHTLTEVVVSVDDSRLQGETVMNVDRLPLQANSQLSGMSLAEKLTGISGMNNWSTGAGIGKPVIRGLSGNRVAVFSQDVRIENQQWGDEHGLGLDESGYSHVEVIKGPASLLYGSDAIGGVLYFVDEPFSQQFVSGGGYIGFQTNSTAPFFGGAAKWSGGPLHINFFVSAYEHTDYKDGNNNTVHNSRFNTGDFKASVGYTGERFTSIWRFNEFIEVYGLTESEEEGEEGREQREEVTGETDKPASSFAPLAPFQKLATQRFTSENTLWFANESRLKATIGYIINRRKEFEEAETPALDMRLNTWSYNAKWYSPTAGRAWTFIAGSQGMHQKNKNLGEETLIPDATTMDVGAFALSNYHYAERAYWQVGIRSDVRNIKGASINKTFTSFNFSTGVFQPVGEQGAIRLNLSSGYRTPNMFELLSDGVHEGTNRYEKGNVALKTENSYQFDLSFRHKSLHLEWFVNPYLNYISNFIHLTPTGEVFDNKDAYAYTQGNAYLYGGEAGIHWHPHPLDWLHIESAYQSTFGQDAHKKPLALMPSQKIHSTVSASFVTIRRIKKLSVYVNHLYSFAQHRIADYEQPTAAYQVFGAGAICDTTWDGRPLQFSLIVNNLLNATYYDHLSRYKTDGIYNIGRNCVMKVSVTL